MPRTDKLMNQRLFGATQSGTDNVSKDADVESPGQERAEHVIVVDILSEPLWHFQCLHNSKGKL